ncbi:MAG: AAA family ATPase [Candidatus Sumerlaeota bacterium]|nr:AAA family ATPase [Candidatus Sumerlaeota bacterium]
MTRKQMQDSRSREPDWALDMESNMRRFNPWWQGKPMPALPSTRRFLVQMMQRRLDQKLAPIVIVRGPRQIGKTTAQLHLIQDMLDRGIRPERIFRIQFDDLSD